MTAELPPAKSPESGPSRRSVLVAGTGTAGVLALAACASGGGGSPAQPTRQAAGRRLTALSAVPVGQCRSVQLPDGSAAIVARPSANSAVCFSAICTHEGCTVSPNGSQLDCPCHGSRFDGLTGAVLNGPATRPLSRIPVAVTNGEVVTTA